VRSSERIWACDAFARDDLELGAGRLIALIHGIDAPATAITASRGLGRHHHRDPALGPPQS
jgi:hypothetical protein